MASNEQALATIVAGVMASGEIPLGPVDARTNQYKDAPSPQDWSVFAEQLRSGSAYKHPGVAIAVGLARHIYDALYEPLTLPEKT